MALPADLTATAAHLVLLLLQVVAVVEEEIKLVLRPLSMAEPAAVVVVERPGMEMAHLVQAQPVKDQTVEMV